MNVSFIEPDTCLIWGTGATNYSSILGERFVADSSRAGGKYCVVDEWAVTKIRRLEDDRERARLTSWLVEQRRLGVEYPEITSNNIESLLQRPALPVHIRADGLLRYVQENTQRIGEPLLAGDFDDLPGMLAYTESVDKGELFYLTSYLIDQGFLKTSNEAVIALIVTVDGYGHLAKLEAVKTDSPQAFVAMWFDDSLLPTLNEGIKPAIEDAGYKSVRIDDQVFPGKIDDQIIAEIRRSRFVVADFTYGKDGARGGVYYEAGFAFGLNIPVIFTCRKDLINNVHFDTRQYPHVVWEMNDLEGFKKRLTDRIGMLIGDGPLK